MTYIQRFGNGSSERRRQWFIYVLLAAGLFTTASYVQADTFKVEIDYMVADDHSHEPSSFVLAAVRQMFACQGHTLTVYTSNAVPHYDVLRRDDCSESLFDYDGSADSFLAIKNANANHSSDDGWHYCLFAHQYEDRNDDGDCVASGSSGLAQTPGWNFVVTLGGWGPSNVGTEFEQAATLAHEFGHNLGLTHCGQDDCNGIGNYLPIMPSIMSYRYQLAGLRTNLLCNGLTINEAWFKEMDFSHGRMCSLDETNLNEPFGTTMRAVDWNCDGTFTTGVSHDINGGRNGWCNSSGTRSWVHDTNEWAKISDPSRYASAADSREVSCITREEWEDVKTEMASRGGCPQPALSIESCMEGENIYVGPRLLIPNYSCNTPADSVLQAHNYAPPNSTFFVKPGTYDETALGTIVLDKPGKWFCNIGTAIIR